MIWRQRFAWLFAPFYIVAIVAANVLTATEPPLQIHWVGQDWVITWGTFLIAVTFFLRDALQMTVGRTRTYCMIAVALLASVLLSRHYGDLAWVTIGSGAAFAFSETLDTEVFTRLHSSLGLRVAISGVLGGTLDSAIFAVVGLSPLTTNIVPWEFLWTTVVAQVAIKCATNIAIGLTISATSEPEGELA